MTKTSPFPYPVRVEVEWEDAHSVNPWMHKDEMSHHLQPVLCRSVGYLVASDKQGVKLVQTANAEDGVFSGLCIPRGMVKKVTKLR